MQFTQNRFYVINFFIIRAHDKQTKNAKLHLNRKSGEITKAAKKLYICFSHTINIQCIAAYKMLYLLQHLRAIPAFGAGQNARSFFDLNIKYATENLFAKGLGQSLHNLWILTLRQKLPKFTSHSEIIKPFINFFYYIVFDLFFDFAKKSLIYSIVRLI